MGTIYINFETDSTSEEEQDRLMANLVDRIRYVIVEEFGSDEVMGYEGPYVNTLEVEGGDEVATWFTGEALN